MNDYGAFMEKLRPARNVVIASHYSPDGDGIGATIALAIALERLGKRAVMYNRDAIPDNLRFLPRTERFVRALDPAERFDLAIMVDCAQRKRVSDEFAAHAGFALIGCIDHHKLDEISADVSLIDGEAASTGEVVMRLMRHAGLEVGADVAQCIYTTLVVDTGFFKYSSTSAHVLALAAEMVGLGASPWAVAKHLEESYPASRLKLLSQSLATLKIELKGRYASMEVTQRMLSETGAGIEHSDEFATYPRSIEGVEVAALFREVEGVVKVSLRSKDLVDVARLAHALGGGGHARAAGVRIRAPMAEARQRIFSAVEQALDALVGD